MTGALVSRVLVEGKRAVAVEYRTVRGGLQRAACSGEILLAAGAFHTPQLLELSGIGRPGVLARHGIDVIVPLAGVGENLQDHFQVAVQHGVRTRQLLSEEGKFPRVVGSILKFVFTRRGALAFPAANIG